MPTYLEVMSGLSFFKAQYSSCSCDAAADGDKVVNKMGGKWSVSINFRNKSNETIM